MEKTAVIFDLDGTLWDSVDVIVFGWNEEIGKYKDLNLMTRKSLEGYMGKTIYEICDLHFPELDKEKRYELGRCCAKKATEKLSKKGASMYDGVCEMMEELSKKHSVFIVSNCEEGYIDAFLDNHGTRKYVSDFEYSGRTGRPKGENIKSITERNNIAKAVYVGDTMGDYIATKEAGFEFIFAAYGFGEVNEAKYAAKDTKDIVKLVNKIL